MSENNTFDYIDNDPLVRMTLMNAISKRVNAYVYLDTGSDALVIQKRYLAETWARDAIPFKR